MSGFDAVGDLPGQSDRAFDIQRTFAPEKFMERFAFDVFHYEIEDPVLGFTVVGNAYRVRMLNGRRRLCLAFEASDGLAFLKIVARKHVLTDGLYRDLSC